MAVALGLKPGIFGFAGSSPAGATEIPKWNDSDVGYADGSDAIRPIVDHATGAVIGERPKTLEIRVLES